MVLYPNDNEISVEDDKDTAYQVGLVLDMGDFCAGVHLRVSWPAGRPWSSVGGASTFGVTCRST